MIKKIELVLPPQQAADKEQQRQLSAGILSIAVERITSIRILKRSIDGRSKQVKIRLLAEIYVDELPPLQENFGKLFQFNRNVSKSKTVIIIGCGPAGMFAALRLIEL